MKKIVQWTVFSGVSAERRTNRSPEQRQLRRAGVAFVAAGCANHSLESENLGKHALLAQLVEQLTLNQRVLGSSPRWRTTRQGPGAGNDRANPLLPKSQSRAGNERCRHDDTLVQICGPLVKRSRHRPLTPVTRVRFPHGSPPGRGLEPQRAPGFPTDIPITRVQSAILPHDI